MISVYLTLCGLVWSIRRGWVPVMIAAGIVATQAASFLPDAIVFPAYAVIWLTVGSAAIYQDQPGPGALLIASGLCYLWADLIGADPVAGVAPMVAADVLGLLALLVLGVFGGGGGGRGAKEPDLGRGSDRRGLRSASGLGGLAAAKESPRK